MTHIAPDVPALDVAGVSHRFGERMALDAVSLTIPRGKFCALLGLNGAGKTTLFSLITRLYDNTSGSIKVLGFDVRRQPSEALQNLGAVFQSRTLDADLSVMQNMIYHAALHGFGAAQARARASAELDRAGLRDRMDEKVRQLSGGQMRRVEIARALVHHPRLLLLDEATVGLDVGARQGILSHVRRLIASEELSVLWATHLIDEIEPEDHVAILHKGRVLSQMPAYRVLEETGASDLKSAFNQLTQAPSTSPPRSFT